MAESHPKFDVALVTPDGAAFDGEAEMIIVPGAAGEIGVLARHAPLVATLKAGSTRIHLSPNEVLEFATGPGFFKVELDRALALVDDAVNVKEIDDERARAQLEAAQAELEKVEAGESTRRSLAARAAHQARREPALGLRSHDRLAVRVAALADVHGNAPALEAVLREVERERRPTCVVFCGDLTWGSLPQETRSSSFAALQIPARFVRGNADRMVGVETRGHEDRGWPRSTPPRTSSFLASFEPTVSVVVDGSARRASVTARRGRTRSASPSELPSSGFASSWRGGTSRVVVTAHIHVQYDRVVDGVRLLSPGSVGLPYEGESGYAYWAMLGPDVELRRTPSTTSSSVVERDARAPTIRGSRRSSSCMLEPPSRSEVIEDAERRVFAG